MSEKLNKKDLTGIILAGGKGIRLGRNKGMAELNGRHLIEYVIENLQQCCDEVLISSNSDQCKKFGLPVIPDVFHAKGPMAGIHACLRASSNQHNVVISVDTPFAGLELIQLIVGHHKDALIAAPWYEQDHYEPLCAYYNKKVLPYMEDFFSKGNYKLPDLFQVVPFTPVRMPITETFFNPMMFHNINTEEDLHKAEEYLKELA
jgi:molybdopterin-guanine dinucleotide biosynthesis protein A